MELVIVALAASVTLASRAPLAYADAKAADAAFLKGKELQQKKQYQEACAAFEDSFREDPKIGAQLNVARCYQEWGKTATAHRAYEEALRLAREAKDKRASQIQDLIDELLPAVPVVMISLPPGRLAPEGLTVTVDGQELAHELLGKPRRLDPGPHAVEMRLTGAEPRTLSVTATAKQRSELVLPIDAALAEAASDEPAPPAATGPAAPARGRTLSLIHI